MSVHIPERWRSVYELPEMYPDHTRALIEDLGAAELQVRALRDDRESYLVQLKQIEVLEAEAEQRDLQLNGAIEAIKRLEAAISEAKRNG